MVYLLDRMRRASTGPNTVTFLAPDGGRRVGWAELYGDARRVAAGLQSHGVGPGRPVVILADTSRETITAAMATWLAGGSLTMAPTPARTVDLARYLADTRDRFDSLGEPLVLVGAPWGDAVPALSGGAGRVIPLAEAVGDPPAAAWRPPLLTADAPAILQLTSGTTGAPKIARISHGNLAANIEGIRVATSHEAVHGRMLSWLPLSHDMGLIGGFILPMACGRCDTLLSSPADYLARPASWMQLVSHHRATNTVGPGSAYAVAARLLRTGPRLDLSCLAYALCGGEPIDPAVVDDFLDAAGGHGFHPASFTPAYGLAEATVAVTFSAVGRGPRYDTVDADALAAGTARFVPPEPAARLVSPEPAGPAESPEPAEPAEPAVPAMRTRRLALLGEPIPGLSVRVVDPDSGGIRPERKVGEVQVRGTSVTASYHDDPESAAALRARDGWLATGDLGYLTGGELVVCGRRKDVIILGGRNIYPEEVERAAARAEGARAGNIVAFPYPRPGHLGGEGLAVAVETRGADPAALRSAVAEKVRAALGVTPHAVLVLEPGSVPKTPSGKLQRAEARRRFTP
ncbi:acyl-CoA synthetase (AMP-forming)/AMP-acid ligase II [Frankia torreyi]|uniref:Acyl-CoA synthetase (AMP-forming)/AMP-acid ligase II n=2 Tax=Frankiaceae TaxID=74712 RepID=A0A0D8BK64_9ACTN|nr:MULTISPECIES: long-chain-fatty-acid--CoA ligase [Frankia]KJE24404.1 acyl-CoA synthetase (AMP-forming)/AMP-acid ligase II [Frankia torreyi]